MKLVKMLAAAIVMMISTNAFADCTIKLSLCKPMAIRSATSFADNYQGSAHDPNRCLARAREYLNYCNSNQQVGAEFSVNGILTVSSYVTPTTSQVWTKTATGLWILLKPSY